MSSRCLCGVWNPSPVPLNQKRLQLDVDVGGSSLEGARLQSLCYELNFRARRGRLASLAYRNLSPKGETTIAQRGSAG